MSKLTEKPWIDVEDTTPTMPFQNKDGRYSQSVLALTKHGVMRVCWYRDYNFELAGEGHVLVEDVTYWMELPDPPPASAPVEANTVVSVTFPGTTKRLCEHRRKIYRITENEAGEEVSVGPLCDDCGEPFNPAPVEQPAQPVPLVERMRSAAIEGGASIDWTAALRVALDEAHPEPDADDIESFRSSWFANGGGWEGNTRRILEAWRRRIHTRLLAPAAPVDPELEAALDVFEAGGYVRKDVTRFAADIVAAVDKARTKECKG